MDGGGLDEHWPLTGRGDELTRIEHSGNRGVVLAGDAGVGKSRLLLEVATRDEAAGRRVVRVMATHSLAGVPFGAFAGVLAGTPDAGAPFDVLQRALRVFAGGGSLTDVTISVDDAHLLDDASAGLLMLAVQSGARVLATVRSGERVPDAVTRLWKDELASRVELAPFTEEQVGALLEAALGGQVDGHARHRFFEVTRGNLLFLRELVRDARHNGSLVSRGGVWSWTAPVTDAPNVRELVLDRIGRVSEAVRELAELLAVAEPLGAGIATELTSEGAVRDAEADGLVRWDTSGARREIRLIHPLYADFLRESLGGAKRAALSLRVADRLAATGSRRHDDRLRIAVMRLDAGVPGDADELNQATRDAFVRADTLLGERLARAAIAQGGSPESDILLGDVLYWSGRHDEVVELLGSGIIDTAPADVAVRATIHVASSLYWGLGRFDEADACLEHGIERTGMPHALELIGQRAQMLMFAGRAIESIEVGRAVIDDPEASIVAKLRAYSGMLPSAASCGRIQYVDKEVPVAMGLVTQIGSDMAFASGGVMVGAFIARLFSGGLDQLDLLIGALHDDALRRVDDPFRGVWAFLLGRSALAQGKLADATTRLRDAASLLRERDPGRMLPWALAALAQTLGATADATGSAQAMSELDVVRVPTMHNIDIEIELGRAWAAGARGERSHARELAEKAGREQIDDGRVATGAFALHDALRLGTEPAVVLDALDEAAKSCDASVVETYAAHARALLENDAEGLLATAELFAGAGMLLHAAECAAGASRLAAQQGLRSRQRDAAVQSAEYAAPCGAALTPMLETLVGKSALGSLTRREQEIALMAARGLSKREIAESLFLSTRTIGNHINHVYGKLGISSREELRAAVGVQADAE